MMNFWPFNRKKPVTPSDSEDEQLDFDELMQRVVKLSPRAQASLMYRLIEVLPPGVVATTRNYTLRKLSDYDKDSTIRPKNNHPAGGITVKRTGNR
jgi:hypothetical protein